MAYKGYRNALAYYRSITFMGIEGTKKAKAGKRLTYWTKRMIAEMRNR